MRSKLLTFILLIVVTSCTNHFKDYYESGGLRNERYYDDRNDTTEYLMISYYKNGQVKSKGKIIDGKKSGLWQEWYSDGILRWEGKYVDGMPKIPQLPAEASIQLKDSIVKVGVRNSLKVSVQGLHPSEIMICCTNAVITGNKNQDFDYDITPEKPGLIKISYGLYLPGDTITLNASDTNIINSLSRLYPLDTLIAK